MQKATYNITIRNDFGKGTTSKEVNGYIYSINGYIIGLHKNKYARLWTVTELSTGFSIPLMNDPYDTEKKANTIDNTLDLLCRTMAYYSKQLKAITEKEARYDISRYNPKTEILSVYTNYTI